jgi:hypothetical protein
MKKLLIALATVGLFSGAGIVLACDYHDHQQDASTEAMPMASVGSPAAIASAKPDPTAVTSKKATTKTTKKTVVKSEPMALAAQRD